MQLTDARALQHHIRRATSIRSTITYLLQPLILVQFGILMKSNYLHSS